MQSDDALAELAAAIERPEAGQMLRARAQTLRGRIHAHLWDEASGTYVPAPHCEVHRVRRCVT